MGGWSWRGTRRVDDNRSGVFGSIGTSIVCPALIARSVTSEEVDGRMGSLLSNMLYRFHYDIVDEGSGQRYSVWDLLESVRAVRDVSVSSS